MNYENDKCILITNYIVEHIHEELTISVLAEAFNTSESTLRRTVESCYGMAVHEYVRQLKMERAIQLLNDIDIPIKAVSGMVGFPYHSTFTRSFTEYFGISPKKIRKSVKRKAEHLG